MTAVLRLLVVAAAAASLAACGAGESADAPRAAAAAPPKAQAVSDPWPTAAEMRWLRSYIRWDKRFHDELWDALAALDGEGDLVAAIERMTACYSSLAAETDVPPTKRLRDLRKGAAGGCRAFQRAFHVVRTRPEPTEDDRRRVELELDEAFKAFAVVHGRLPLGAARDLPEREGAGGESHVEPRFSRAASEIAEKEVDVRCWSAPDWKQLMRQQALAGRKPRDVHRIDGFVASVGGQRIHLSPLLCRLLVAAVGGPGAGDRAEADAGYALLALAHEAWHAAGVADEAKATCYALQTADELTHALDVERSRIDRFVEVFWEEYNALPPAYRSPQCKKGGELDLHPEDGRFP